MQKMSNLSGQASSSSDAPPNLPLSNFTKNFLRINQISPKIFGNWQFLPGMKFQDKRTWWKDLILRKNPHEGVDLQAYCDCHGNLIPLDGRSCIPVLFGGTVAQIFDDFQGKSIHLIHDIFREDGGVLNSLFGHTLPVEGLKVGSVIGEGEEIASVALNKGAVVPPHLHLTTFWTQVSNKVEKINWSTICDGEVAELFDPMLLIDK